MILAKTIYNVITAWCKIQCSIQRKLKLHTAVTRTGVILIQHFNIYFMPSDSISDVCWGLDVKN
jgi:hypothetical protein